MKSVLLKAFVLLLVCCVANGKAYSYSPVDFDSGFDTKYKFQIEGLTGYVTNAQLWVSPAARPIWNTMPSLYGGESTSPLLSDPPHTYHSIGQRYINRNLLFNEYWAFDVTQFMRAVKSPYVMIGISGGSFTRDAYLSVSTGVPEPSSLVLVASCVGTALLLRRRRRAC